VQKAAAESIGRYGKPEAAPFLDKAITLLPDGEVKKAAQASLATLKAPDGKATDNQ
jgi:hypothetical protein